MAPRTSARLIRQTKLPVRAAPALVPSPPAAMTRGATVQAMVELLVTGNPGSTAEALKTLRLGFPDSPLALRLAALAAAMKDRRVDPDGLSLRC